MLMKRRHAATAPKALPQSAAKRTAWPTNSPSGAVNGMSTELAWHLMDVASSVAVHSVDSKYNEDERNFAG